jgi:hypothetical protein
MGRPLSMLLSILKKTGEKTAPAAVRNIEPTPIRNPPRDPRATKNA